MAVSKVALDHWRRKVKRAKNTHDLEEFWRQDMPDPLKEEVAIISIFRRRKDELT